MNPISSTVAEDDLDDLIVRIAVVSELLQAGSENDAGQIRRRLDEARRSLLDARSGARELRAPETRPSESALRLIQTTPAA